MNAYANSVVSHLLAQSWQVALLAGLVGLSAFALRNRSAHLRYLLWLVVLAKCLAPPLLTIPLAILPGRSAPGPSAALVNLPEEHLAPEIPVFAGPDLPPDEPAPVKPTVRVLIALAWMAGVFLFVLWVGGRAVRYTTWLRAHRRPLPPSPREAVQDPSLGFHFRKWPRIWLLNDISQPFVWGLVRGSVYLPADFPGLGNSDRQRSILAHELSHIARWDAGVNLLQVLAQAVYWFHPFVWWGNKKIRQEREKCCDEMAVAYLHTPPEYYTGAIVDALAAEHRSAHPIPPLAIVGSVRDIEERIRTMLKPGKTFRTRPSLAAVTITLLVAFVTIPSTFVLTARGQDQPPTRSIDQPAPLPSEAAASSEEPEQPRFAARTFNSQRSWRVFFEETSLSKWNSVQSTPRPAPLKIPACWCWWVQTQEPVKDWELLVRELNESKVPGLRLLAATDADVKHLAGLTELVWLDLGKAGITDTGLASLKDLLGMKLEKLGLVRTRVTNAGLAHVTGLTRLRRLDLVGMSLTDAGLRPLGGLTRLRRLELLDCRIAAAGLQNLRGLIQLQMLDLSYTRAEGGWVFLGDLVELQDLRLDNTQVTDSALVPLKRLTNLRVLDLTNTKITDKGLEHFKDARKLTALALDGTQITDAGLEYLQAFPNLRHLLLGGTQITDAGLKHLKDMPELQDISLDNTPITGSGLAHLNALPNLRSLRLSGTQITDAGLEHLKGLRALRSLILNHTRITDASIKHIESVTELQTLSFYDTQVTDLGIQRLKRSLPRLHVSRIPAKSE